MTPAERADLLLSAALAESAGSLHERWSEWRRAAGSLDRLEMLEHRLLPCVWRRLHDAELPDAEDARLRGVYKKTWYYNQHLLSVSAGLQRELHEAGIASVLLKGVATMLVAYPEIGLRKTSDVDLYVAPCDFRRAAGMLRARYERRLVATHAIQFSSADRRGIDLHRATSQWSAIHPVPEIDAQLVARARRIEWQGRALVVPDPTDLAYHNLSNAFSHHSPAQNAHHLWLVDVRMLGDRAPLDLDRLVALVERQRATALWRHHLRSVERHLTGPFRELQRRLEATPLRPDERRVDRALNRAAERRLIAEGSSQAAWWLTLRGVPGGGALHSLGMKAAYFGHRIRHRLCSLHSSGPRPIALSQKLGGYAAVARLLLRH